MDRCFLEFHLYPFHFILYLKESSFSQIVFASTYAMWLQMLFLRFWSFAGGCIFMSSLIMMWRCLHRFLIPFLSHSSHIHDDRELPSSTQLQFHGGCTEGEKSKQEASFVPPSKDDNCSSSCKSCTCILFVNVAVYHGTFQFINCEKKGFFPFYPFFPFSFSFFSEKNFTLTQQASLQLGILPPKPPGVWDSGFWKGLFLSQTLLRDNNPSLYTFYFINTQELFVSVSKIF